MAKVSGKDVIVYVFIDGNWLPYVCAQGCSLDVQTEFIETTFLNSGKNRDFEPTYNSFTGEITGIVDLNHANAVSLPDLRALQLQQAKLRMRYQRQDIDSNVYTDEAYFYISSSRDEGSINGMNTFAIGLKGTGAITQLFTPTNITGGKVTRDQFTLPASLLTVTRPALIGMDLLEVVRDGIGNSKILTTGSPANKEVVFDDATGQLTWAIPFADDGTEEAYLLYQTP